MNARALRLLYLYRLHDVDAMRAAIAHHLYALANAGLPHKVLYHNVVEGVPSWLRALRFDAVLLHTTFLGMRWGGDLFTQFKWKIRWLNELDVPKLAFPQDEYDHSDVLDEWLLELGVTDVFSVFDSDVRAALYPLTRDRVRFHRAFTGYIDDATARSLEARMVAHADRPFDVVYRASHLPYRFGSHGQLKHRIGLAARDAAGRLGLAADISTRAEDVLEGGAWLDFMMSGRATIGTESGSSGVDRRGEIGAAVDAMVAAEPGLTFEQVSARLPAGWDDHRYFAISPRHLEAVLTRTAQILVEGHYDGIFEPERHYLPVRRDLSDLEEALARAREPRLLEALVDAAYEDVYRSGRYSSRAFAGQIDAVLADAVGPLRRPMPAPAYRVAEGALAAFGAAARRRPSMLLRLVQAPSSSLIKGAAALQLALRSPVDRRLLFDFLRARAARRGTTLHQLLADVLRLGVLRQARGRFALVPVLEEERRKLAFYSRPLGADARGGTAVAEVETALRSGRVNTIVWDHSAVGASLPLDDTGLELRVGVAGTHRFDALAAVARAFPDDAADALAPLLRFE